MGAAFGVLGGYLAAFAIESLHRGFPYESNWKWQFRRGRVPATNFAAMYGLIGGVVASGLSAGLNAFKGWARQQRERDAMTDELGKADIPAVHLDFHENAPDN